LAKWPFLVSRTISSGITFHKTNNPILNTTDPTPPPVVPPASLDNPPLG
jgi:hypothetical protein